MNSGKAEPLHCVIDSAKILLFWNEEKLNLRVSLCLSRNELRLTYGSYNTVCSIALFIILIS